MIIGIVAGVLVAVGLLLAWDLGSRPRLDLARLQADREAVLRKECADLGWTLIEQYPGLWIVRGPDTPPNGYAAHSLMGIQRFLDGFVWGRAMLRRLGEEHDGTPAER